MLVVQMAGAPGSGKSTLATALVETLAERFDVVVLDMDIVKSALLEAEAPWQIAGRGAYNVVFALAGSLLAHGRSVLIDSPSHYSVIPARGQHLAAAYGADYRFIECVCDDVDELRRRLTARTPHRSQMRGVGSPPPDADAPIEATQVGAHRWQTYGPETGHLVVDTTKPEAEGLRLAVNYLVTGTLEP